MPVILDIAALIYNVCFLCALCVFAYMDVGEGREQERKLCG
ncbi:hypothetical protein [Thiohalomonas denitrificans]|nr:hypothetical protein [Thiohalomonas denitrificans]